MPLILASSSPRRIQMFKDLGVRFQVIKPKVAEVQARGESPEDYVLRLSRDKAMAVAQRLKDLKKNYNYILAADTTVIIGKRILEKPKSKKDALRMLKALSGRTHQVATAFSWLRVGKGTQALVSEVLKTNVRFAKRSEAFWKWYVSTGEPMDKAGAYAAQGIGMSFVDSYEGSYANVVGLPLPQVIDCFLDNFGQKALEENFPCFRKT